MPSHESNAESSVEEQQEFEEAVKCRACGTMQFAVDEGTARKMMAAHVLEEHSDQAPEELLEECREVLDS